MRMIEEIMENKRQKYENIVRKDLQKIKILRISEETERKNLFVRILFICSSTLLINIFAKKAESYFET